MKDKLPPPPRKKKGVVVVVVGGISKEKQIKISCENNLNMVLELVPDFVCLPWKSYYVTLENQRNKRLAFQLF